MTARAVRSPGPATAPAATAGGDAAPAVAVIVPAVLALAAGLWDLGAPPLWRDEAATVSAGVRTMSELAHLLHTVDAVHGLYYALMHVVIALFGTAEVTLRLPSVIAGTLAAAGVGALGRALGNPRAGLYGGALLATMPVFSRYVQEARPYSLTMAVAVGSALLLLRALRRPTARAFAGYGAALVLLGCSNLFALLTAAGHGVHVVRSRGPVARWCAAVAAALGAIAPLVWLASRQTAQIGWISPPGTAEVGLLAVRLFGDLGAGEPAWVGVAPVAWALALLGLAAALRPGRTAAARELPRLTVPWLFVPPLALLAVSWAAQPVYVFRYVFCCVPAAALLAGAGLSAVPRKAVVAVFAAWCGLSVPGHLATRGPDGRQDDPRPLMAVLAAQARPGDGVLFVPGRVRKYLAVYPQIFAGLTDVALARPPERDGSFSGRDVGRRVLAARLARVRTLWVVGHTGESAVRRLDRMRRSLVSPPVPAGRWVSRGLFLARYTVTGSSKGAGVGK